MEEDARAKAIRPQIEEPEQKIKAERAFSTELSRKKSNRSVSRETESCERKKAGRSPGTIQVYGRYWTLDDAGR